MSDNTIGKNSYEFSISKVQEDITIDEYQVLITNGLEINPDVCFEISELGSLEII